MEKPHLILDTLMDEDIKNINKRIVEVVLKPGGHRVSLLALTDEGEEVTEQGIEAEVLRHKNFCSSRLERRKRRRRDMSADLLPQVVCQKREKEVSCVPVATFLATLQGTR